MAYNPATGLVYIRHAADVPVCAVGGLQEDRSSAARPVPGVDWNEALDATEALMRQLGGALSPIAAT
jgi:hypothetical protein